MDRFILLFIILTTLYFFNTNYINIMTNKNNQTYYNFTGTTLDYCKIKDFTGDTYTGWCYDTIFIPSKNFSWDTIYLTGERINWGIINNWKYGEIWDACYSWDDIQGDIIDCWIN